MDDPISNRIRRGPRSAGGRFAPLSSRAESELQGLLHRAETHETAPPADRRTGRSSARARAWPLLAPLAAASAIALVAIGSFAPGEATASTPPLLDVTPLPGMTAHEALGICEDASRQDRDTRPKQITVQSWAMGQTIGEDEEILEERIIPEESTLVFNPDGSQHLRVVAAEPFPGQEADGLPEPGTLLRSERIPPDEASYFPVPIPEDHTGTIDYLEYHFNTVEPSAGLAMETVTDVAITAPITPGEECALLNAIPAFGQVEVLGQVTDRLGLPGIALLAADQEPGVLENLIVLSPETGRIIAAEKHRLTSDFLIADPPAVVLYDAIRHD